MSWALAALALAVLLSSLGTSIANVSLPTLAREYAATFQQVQWVVSRRTPARGDRVDCQRGALGRLDGSTPVASERACALYRRFGPMRDCPDAESVDWSPRGPRSGSGDHDGVVAGFRRRHGAQGEDRRRHGAARQHVRDRDGARPHAGRDVDRGVRLAIHILDQFADGSDRDLLRAS